MAVIAALPALLHAPRGQPLPAADCRRAPHAASRTLRRSRRHAPRAAARTRARRNAGARPSRQCPAATLPTPAPNAAAAPASHPRPQPLPRPASRTASSRPLPSAQSDLLEQRLLATERWLAEAQGGTLQHSIAGLERSRTLEKLFRNPGKYIEIEKVFVYRTLANQQPSLTVLYGAFGSRADAVKSLEALPDELKANRPYIRTVQGIRVRDRPEEAVLSALRPRAGQRRRLQPRRETYRNQSCNLARMHNRGFGHPGGMVNASLNSGSRRAQPQRHGAERCVRRRRCLSLLLRGCAYKPTDPAVRGPHQPRVGARPRRRRQDPAAGHQQHLRAAAQAAQSRPPTYSVVVNEVPVKELLLALARDTKQNIDIHPGLQGLVSLNADRRDAARDPRPHRQAGEHALPRRGQDDRGEPGHAVLQDLRVNYVNMTRDTTSDHRRSAGRSRRGGAGGTGSCRERRHIARPSVNTDLEEQFLGGAAREHPEHPDLHASTGSERRRPRKRRPKLRARRARNGWPRQKPSRARARTPPACSTTVFGSSPSSAVDRHQAGHRRQPVAGTVSVMATERQHQLVQQYLDSHRLVVPAPGADRSDHRRSHAVRPYQAGVDWSRARHRRRASASRRH